MRKKSTFGITIKEVKEFIFYQETLYASYGGCHFDSSGCGIKFYVRLKAAPGIERYIIDVHDKRKAFTKISDAVRYFNQKVKESNDQ